MVTFPVGANMEADPKLQPLLAAQCPAGACGE
jgi:hypothetical protein